jgi:5-phospho-D-xylono-1,4-lactonase
MTGTQPAPAAGTVRTVTGDIAATELGRTDYHEHLLMRSPLLAGDELDDVDLSARESEELRDAGIDALAELTPIGCGRDPAGVRAIAERTGMAIILATGVHREAHYGPDHWIRGFEAEDLVERFVADITQGCGPDPAAPTQRHSDDDAGARVRAGVIKVGIGYWSISDVERRVLLAAAEANRITGAPIVCHLELGTAAWEVAELFADAGVALDDVALAHADRNPDPVLHADLAAAGLYLGYDGAARTKNWPDSMLIDCMVQVAGSGGAERVLLGGDVSRRTSFRSYGGLPGMAYLPRVFVPRVVRAGGDELARVALVDNPARFFSLAPR